MRRGEIITAFILGIFSVYLMWKSGEPPAWNPDVPRFANIGYDESGTPGSGFWPFWLGVMMLASCIWTGFSWALKRTPASVSEEPLLDAHGWKMLITVGGGLLGFTGLIHILGAYGAILVFLLYYIRFLGKHAWVKTISISVSVPVVCFFFFDIAMRIVLPKGYLEPLFIPLYDIFL